MGFIFKMSWDGGETVVSGVFRDGKTNGDIYFGVGADTEPVQTPSRCKG